MSQPWSVCSSMQWPCRYRKTLLQQGHQLAGNWCGAHERLLAMAAVLLAAAGRTEQTESPMLLPRSEQEELLQGSPVLQEAQQRSKALDEEWQSLSPTLPSLLQSSGGLQGAHDSTGSINMACKQRCVLRGAACAASGIYCQSSVQPSFWRS